MSLTAKDKAIQYVIEVQLKPDGPTQQTLQDKLRDLLMLPEYSEIPENALQTIHTHHIQSSEPLTKLYKEKMEQYEKEMAAEEPSPPILQRLPSADSPVVLILSDKESMRRMNDKEIAQTLQSKTNARMKEKERYKSDLSREIGGYEANRVMEEEEDKDLSYLKQLYTFYFRKTGSQKNQWLKQFFDNNIIKEENQI